MEKITKPKEWLNRMITDEMTISETISKAQNEVIEFFKHNAKRVFSLSEDSTFVDVKIDTEWIESLKNK